MRAGAAGAAGGCKAGSKPILTSRACMHVQARAQAHAAALSFGGTRTARAGRRAAGHRGLSAAAAAAAAAAASMEASTEVRAGVQAGTGARGACVRREAIG